LTHLERTLFQARGDVPTLVPLNDDADGAIQEYTFTNDTPGKRYVLTYSAACGVADSKSNWVDLDILVNGVVVPPTVGRNDAFCSNSLSFLADALRAASITVAIPAVEGTNRVSIQARTRFVRTFTSFTLLRAKLTLLD
jgi:hypothetical protein